MNIDDKQRLKALAECLHEQAEIMEAEYRRKVSNFKKIAEEVVKLCE